MKKHPRLQVGAVVIACVSLSACCPCSSDAKPPKPESTTPSVGLTPPAGSAAAHPSEGPACTGDMADSELPCTLPDRRTGWCKGGRCKDVCPAGFSYSPLDTQCHKPCGGGCKQCMDSMCLDDATTRPMLEN